MPKNALESRSLPASLSSFTARRNRQRFPTMEKIIEYKVVGGGNPQHLAEAVNQLIGEGFEPFGNVFQQGNVFLQPMVKRAPDVTPPEFR